VIFLVTEQKPAVCTECCLWCVCCHGVFVRRLFLNVSLFSIVFKIEITYIIIKMTNQSLFTLLIEM
jgi:hypothetical protein